MPRALRVRHKSSWPAAVPEQRLRGWGGNLSRQVGGRASGGVGIGRGPGETKLETDRRRISSRIAKLRTALREMDVTWEAKRAGRRRHEVPICCHRRVHQRPASPATGLPERAFSSMTVRNP